MMGRMLVVAVLILSLLGCSNAESIEPGMKLRKDILDGNGCKFDSIITADYGDTTYTFNMQCQTDRDGNLSFVVVEPESISGISGRIYEDEGLFAFDSSVLAFKLLADEQITPISGPWLFVKALRNGYIRACEVKDSSIHLIIDDNYEQQSLQADVYLTADHIPVQADFLWGGRRIITVQVENFHIL